MLMSSMSSIFKPAKHVIIEKTAAELAGVFYDAGRSAGMISEYKSAKAFARAKLQVFIPKAVELLLSMLGRADLPDIMKREIFDALQERANDPTLNELGVIPTRPTEASRPIQERIVVNGSFNHPMLKHLNKPIDTPKKGKKNG